MEEHARGADGIREALGHLETRMDRRFELVDGRFTVLEDKVNRRFEAVDARFTALEERIDRRFETVDARFTGLEEKLDRRFGIVEEQISRLNYTVVGALTAVVAVAGGLLFTLR